MATNPTVHPVYKSMNTPLTILGIDRSLFFMAAVMGAATFNLLGSLISGLLMFGALYWFGRWATVTDPQILRIVLNSSKFKRRYDPAKRDGLSRARTVRP